MPQGSVMPGFSVGDITVVHRDVQGLFSDPTHPSDNPGVRGGRHVAVFPCWLSSPVSQTEASSFCNNATDMTSRHSHKSHCAPRSLEASSHRECSFKPDVPPRPDAACQLGVILTISSVPGRIADILLVSGFQKNRAESMLTKLSSLGDEDVLWALYTQIVTEAPKM